MKAKTRYAVTFFLVLCVFGIAPSHAEEPKPGWYILYAQTNFALLDDNTRKVWMEEKVTQRDDALYEYLHAYVDRLGTLVCRKRLVDEDLNVVSEQEVLYYHGKKDSVFDPDIGIVNREYWIEKTSEGLDLVTMIQLIPPEELKKEPEQMEPYPKQGIIYHYRYWGEAELE